MPVRHGSLRVPGISVIDWHVLQTSWKKIEQDQYAVRSEHRRKSKNEKLRKDLVKIIGNGTMRALFASVEVRAPDSSQAEGRTDNPNDCQWPHSCASVQEEGDRVEHEKSLKAVEDNWISVSAPCMPILTSVNFNSTGHRQFLADLDFPFNLLVAEPMTRTQRRQIPKAQAACDYEWERNHSRDPFGTRTRFASGMLLLPRPSGLELKCMLHTCLRSASSRALNLMTKTPVRCSRLDEFWTDLG